MRGKIVKVPAEGGILLHAAGGQAVEDQQGDPPPYGFAIWQINPVLTSECQWCTK